MPTAVAISQIPGTPGKVYYPLSQISIPAPSSLPANNLTIRITAAALNHRDLFIRQHLYPGTSFGIPLCADGCGVVIATGSSPNAKAWLGKRVILNPGTGWRENPEGPEADGGYKIMGGTKHNLLGTLAEVVSIDAGEVEEAPAHLSDAEAAALPLTGLTAWRACVVKCGRENVRPGADVLVTGIGGGVALMALGFLVQMGVRVWVSSGSKEKIERARELGAKGGVSYREEGWEKKLVGMVERESGGKKKVLDAIVDGAGGGVVEKGWKILKTGGVIVSYGMTISPKMPFLMAAVLKNIELRGSTMGSRKEFADMVRFVKDKQIKPVISRVVSGTKGGNGEELKWDLESIDSLFEDMKAGKQFGKLVIEVRNEDVRSKL